APHFPHLVFMRVSPCLTLTVFRSSASFTKRSVSSRVACFELSRLFAFLVTSTAQRILDHQQHRSKPAVTGTLPSGLLDLSNPTLPERVSTSQKCHTGLMQCSKDP